MFEFFSLSSIYAKLITISPSDKTPTSDEKIIAGENSAPGIISLIASCEDQNIKQKLELNQNSNVLVIGCEGDTDKEMYQKLISQN